MKCQAANKLKICITMWLVRLIWELLYITNGWLGMLHRWWFKLGKSLTSPTRTGQMAVLATNPLMNPVYKHRNTIDSLLHTFTLLCTISALQLMFRAFPFNFIFITECALHDLDENVWTYFKKCDDHIWCFVKLCVIDSEGPRFVVPQLLLIRTNFYLNLTVTNNLTTCI